MGLLKNPVTQDALLDYGGCDIAPPRSAELWRNTHSAMVGASLTQATAPPSSNAELFSNIQPVRTGVAPPLPCSAPPEFAKFPRNTQSVIEDVVFTSSLIAPPMPASFAKNQHPAIVGDAPPWQKMAPPFDGVITPFVIVMFSTTDPAPSPVWNHIPRCARSQSITQVAGLPL